MPASFPLLQRVRLTDQPFPSLFATTGAIDRIQEEGARFLLNGTTYTDDLGIEIETGPTPMPMNRPANLSATAQANCIHAEQDIVFFLARGFTPTLIDKKMLGPLIGLANPDTTNFPFAAVSFVPEVEYQCLAGSTAVRSPIRAFIRQVNLVNLTAGI